jgi:hypothetical protein
MEQMNGPLKNAKIRHRDIEKKKGKSVRTALGLIYDVEHKRFHKLYKYSPTGRIGIECICDKADQIAGTSVSAA